MTTKPLIHYRNRPTPIRNALLVFFATGFAFDSQTLHRFIAERQVAQPVKLQVAQADENWVDLVAQAEKKHAKGVRR